MANPSQQFGKKGEDLAVRKLARNGYRIIAQNYSNAMGEIDIIARDGDTVVFVEVKARQSRRFGNAKLAITDRKKRKISMVALSYLKETGQMRSKARFDVVAIDQNDGETVVEVIKNAFGLAYQ